MVRLGGNESSRRSGAARALERARRCRRRAARASLRRPQGRAALLRRPAAIGAAALRLTARGWRLGAGGWRWIYGPTDEGDVPMTHNPSRITDHGPRSTVNGRRIDMTRRLLLSLALFFVALDVTTAAQRGR